jgi:integrase/recombinase XerD
MSTHVSSKSKRTYQTWLEQSVLRPHINTYTNYLSEHRYSPNTVGFYLHSLAHFSHWLTKKKIGLNGINEALVHRFITVHLPACDCHGRCEHQIENVRAALGHLLRDLRSKGCIPPRVGPVPHAVREELDRFDSYLDRVCGLASTTRFVRLHYVSKFLPSVFRNGPIDLTRLKPRDIQQFVIRHGEGCTTGSIQVICSCLRTYLRFRG